MTLTVGQTIGPYRVVEQIGRGGMATVYKAHQAALARFVALKVLPTFLAEDAGFAERFRSEAVTVAKLRHPNILQVFDYGQDQGLHYLVSEFVDGGTLAEQIGASLPLDYVVRTLSPIASALDYAHARDVVHRDVKPSNVLLARDGTPVLSDFGLARMMMSETPRLTRTGAVVGTPEYMAPEQATGGDAGAAADRYALAVIAYEMLTGSVPFSADTPLATLLAHAHRPLPLPREKNPNLSPAVEAALLRGLAKEPGDRYATARELVTALESAHAAAPAVATSSPAPSPLAAPATGAVPSRRGLFVGAIAAAVVLVALGIAAAAGIIGGHPVAAPGSATPTSTAPTSVPPTVAASLSAIPAGALKGNLIWQASLDPSTDLHNVNHSASAALGVTAGAVECAVLQAGGTASGGLGRSTAAPYYVEMDVSTQAQTNYIFIWSVRTSPSGNYQVRIETPTGGGGRLQVAWLPASLLGGSASPSPGATPEVMLPAPVTVAGWSSGRRLTLAVAARADSYTIFIDGQQVASVRGDRIPTTLSTVMGLACSGGVGTARVTGLRVYELLTP